MESNALDFLKSDATRFKELSVNICLLSLTPLVDWSTYQNFTTLDNGQRNDEKMTQTRRIVSPDAPEHIPYTNRNIEAMSWQRSVKGEIRRGKTQHEMPRKPPQN
ncbi:hypothetical protein L596_004754 [Steinernema carpocapsae]|uniref:Uncharacterized protein n=1 Tax=Steinernema carpocapsae TaxID=34508 RepID=A0A4U8UYD7_STECR|nr:hypothetical protein L596_004754 [Steinernema carpocapsae]